MNMNEIRQKRNKIIAYIIIFVLVVSILLNKWVMYWIYYKPFYILFKNNTYLPFYLYIFEHLVAVIILLFALIVPLSKSWKINILQKSLILLLTILWLNVYGINIYKDTIIMLHKNIQMVECNIINLFVYSDDDLEHYRIRPIIDEIVDKNKYIEMDFYQYQKLLNEQKRSKNKIIVVYYLPHTKRMISYE
ncbi:hypothetical protein FACS1894158_01450 [Betaproteobacteria bacterium]|nr:hypothetical protein FACS1894158_01450 [Betaproteobacteria bacterium]